MSSLDQAGVLVVEDEPLLRMAAVAFIEEAGFRVVEAANADQAIIVLETRNDIDLLFTDIDMPFGSMNGLKLAHMVFSRWPPVRIVIVSGHQTPGEADMPAGSRFFTKPYQEPVLIAAMREMLAA